MNAEKSLKGALILSIVCPEELVDQALTIAARAANLVGEGVIERVKAEIEEMTNEELFQFLEEEVVNG